MSKSPVTTHSHRNEAYLNVRPTTRLGTRNTFARLTFTSRRLCQSSRSISLSTVNKLYVIIITQPTLMLSQYSLLSSIF